MLSQLRVEKYFKSDCNLNEKKNQHFFRQFNVFTKEMISRKFFGVF